MRRSGVSLPTKTHAKVDAEGQLTRLNLGRSGARRPVREEYRLGHGPIDLRSGCGLKQALVWPKRSLIGRHSGLPAPEVFDPPEAPVDQVYLLGDRFGEAEAVPTDDTRRYVRTCRLTTVLSVA